MQAVRMIRTVLLCVTVLVAGAELALGGPRPALRALVVACTDYVNPERNAIATSCEEDRRKVLGLLNGWIRDRRVAWGVDVDVVDLSARDATAERFWRELHALASRTGADDTLFVYFTGHGVMDPDSHGQRMLAADDRFVDRDSVARLLAAHECRLKVLVTDCCSTFLRIPRPLIVGRGGPGTTVHDYRRLFFGHRGFTDVTAASPGQTAYATDDGGWFTSQLLFPFDRAVVSWRAAFQAARDGVQACSNTQRAGKQVPYAYALATSDEVGEPVSPPEVTGVIAPPPAPDPGGTLRVRNVPPGQHLNVRSAPVRPRADDNIVDQIPHDGRGLSATGARDGEWLRIRYRHPDGAVVEGWVHSGYVGPE